MTTATWQIFEMWLVMVLAFIEPNGAAEDAGPLKAVHAPNAATALNQSSRRASECTSDEKANGFDCAAGKATTTKDGCCEDCPSGASFQLSTLKCSLESHEKEEDPSYCCKKCTLSAGEDCLKTNGCCESTSGNACVHSNTCEKCFSGHAKRDGCPAGLSPSLLTNCCVADCSDTPCAAGKTCTAENTCTDIPIANCMEVHVDSGFCKACGQGYRVDRSKKPWDCKACPSGQVTPTDQNPKRKTNGCPEGYMFDTTTECCAVCPGQGQPCLNFPTTANEITSDGNKVNCCAAGTICKKVSGSSPTCLAATCTSADYCRSNFGSGTCPEEKGGESDCQSPYCLNGNCAAVSMNCATTGVKPSGWNGEFCPQDHFWYTLCGDCQTCPATLTSVTARQPCEKCSDHKRVFDAATFTCLTCPAKCSDNSMENCNRCNGCSLFASTDAPCGTCASGHSWLCGKATDVTFTCLRIKVDWVCPPGFGAAMTDNAGEGGCCTACPAGTNCHDSSHCSPGTVCKRTDSAICGTCGEGTANDANEAVTEAPRIFLVLLCYLVSAQKVVLSVH